MAEMAAMEETVPVVETEVPAAEAGMALIAVAYLLMAKPPLAEAAVLPALVVEEVMVAMAETVEVAVTVVLSLSRSRRTTADPSKRLSQVALVARAARADNLARADFPVSRVQAVTAATAIAVHSALMAAQGQPDRAEVPATGVTVEIPERPALPEAMVVQRLPTPRKAVGPMKTANVTAFVSKELVRSRRRS